VKAPRLKGQPSKVCRGQAVLNRGLGPTTGGYTVKGTGRPRRLRGKAAPPGRGTLALKGNGLARKAKVRGEPRAA
jgi:hypothetical protein